jgi:hypothetical protein
MSYSLASGRAPKRRRRIRFVIDLPLVAALPLFRGDFEPKKGFCAVLQEIAPTQAVFTAKYLFHIIITNQVEGG